MNGENPKMEPVSEKPYTDFGWALKRLKQGDSVTREGWNDPGQYLTLQMSDKGSKMTLLYIYIKTVQGDLVPWSAQNIDLLSTDWKPV